MQKKPRQRKCKHCGNKYTPYNSLQKACSPLCALEVGREARKLKEAREAKDKLKAQKEALKPRGEFLKEAQASVNRYVRFRDRHDNCINCGEFVAWDGNVSDAAHFYGRGGHPAMRFDLRNISKSCKKCNKHQDKWIAFYQDNLIDKIGLERFNQLKADRQYWDKTKRNFDIKYLKRIKKIFDKKLKMAKKNDS